MSFLSDDDNDNDGTCRLSSGISLKSILKTEHQFVVESKDESAIVTDVVKEFGWESVEPYCLQEAIHVHDMTDPLDAPFNIFRQKMINLTPDGKVMKQILTHGTGNIVQHGDVVRYHYTFYVEGNASPFDVSYLRKMKPIQYQVGSGTVIPGLDIAIRSMKNKELAQFLIHPSLAFGALGCPPRVPRDATILARLELFDVHASDGVPEEEDSEPNSFESSFKEAKQYHVLGNDYFKHNDMARAIAKYNKAVEILQRSRLIPDAEMDQIRERLSRLYSNLAICYYNVQKYKYVCLTANDAFRDCPKDAFKNSKLLYYAGKALRLTGCYEEALTRLRQANALNPQNKQIQEELIQADKASQMYKKSEKSMFTKMFQFANNATNKPDKNKRVYDAKKYKEYNEMIEEFVASDDTVFPILYVGTDDTNDIINDICAKLNLKCERDPLVQNIVIRKR